MKVWALVADTWREAKARYTLLGFVMISTLFLFILTFALNLDIVNGSLAAGSLFGKSFGIQGQGLAIDKVVVTGQSVFAGMLYGLGIFLAIFATGPQVPHLQHRGTVDLYLSRPVSRTTILLGRFLGGVSLVVANLIFLCGGVFLIISLKTGVWNFRFLLAGLLILLVFFSLAGFMYLIGTLSSSTPLSIMVPYALYILSLPLAAHDHIAASMDSRFWANVVQTLYWILPKTSEIGTGMVKMVLGEGQPSMVLLTTTGAFGLVCLGLAVVVFNRKSF